ncbi:Calcineurin-like phosphoesterase [Dyadobacter psychrophilus]|uniref:Calcineurin-like phosphoesterase n=1 Tax=Dyadobacter psychrophilus TaxID=651661 RepID=A0A1T5D9D5_9BACT|nr:Calcineurin-like phosphoesterase [Dyadobacter psychrophilus]
MGDGETWENYHPDTNLTLKHRMYLIGDAGNAVSPETTPSLSYLNKKLSEESANTSILFLGDNIYPKGMPPRDNKIRRAAEYSLMRQLDVLIQFKGHPIFIPGNHDWKFKTIGVDEQRKFIQQHLDSYRFARDAKIFFYPENLGIGPDKINLSEHVALLVFDSHQLLMNWNKKSTEKNSNNIRTKKYFKKKLEDTLKTLGSKHIVIAMHHPPYSYGPHGGRYNLKQHLLPVTELESAPSWLYLPLPIIGSVYVGVRTLLRVKADVHNCRYHKLRRVLLSATDQRANVTFVSGHEHTLQYIETKGHSFVVSGSGSKSSPVGLKKNKSLFASTKIGYSVMDFYDKDQTWITYFSVREDGSHAEPIFRRKLNN